MEEIKEVSEKLREIESIISEVRDYWDSDYLSDLHRHISVASSIAEVILERTSSDE